MCTRMIDHDFLRWDAGEAEDAEGVTPFPPAPRPVPGDSDPRRLLDVFTRRCAMPSRRNYQCATVAGDCVRYRNWREVNNVAGDNVG
jgi:hypothetical protein